MTIQEMIARKRELGYTNEMIAEQSGVPLGTVQKIFAGQTNAPRRKTIEALERILSEKKSYVYPNNRPDAASGMLRESAAAYATAVKADRYTIDDYEALPEDRRAELIDGQFYDMAAPDKVHQMILGDMFYQLYPCVLARPGCRLLFAPVDVRLDRDQSTMVQPDLLIVCREDDPDPRRVNGAPDFIAEILSESTRYHDMFRKLGKYKNAGVREYWIVDPKNLKVTVYDFEEDVLPETYHFTEEVALRISDGNCRVDFKRIYERLKIYPQ